MMHRIGDRIEASGGCGAAAWLGLAAAPSFAAMALLTGLGGGGMAEMPCLGMPHASPLSGMTAMYVLMGVFHLGPWLRLVRRGRGA